jgi:hypothetical protein
MAMAWHEVQVMPALLWVLALGPRYPWEDDQKDQFLDHRD